jgi:hypothetical protein
MHYDAAARFNVDIHAWWGGQNAANETFVFLTFVSEK